VCGLCAVGPSVTAPSTAFSFPKPGFFGIYLNFQWQKSLKKSISPTILDLKLNKLKLKLNKSKIISKLILNNNLDLLFKIYNP
jgi:hypothetical protein